jgi:hypothetical protein
MVTRNPRGVSRSGERITRRRDRRPPRGRGRGDTDDKELVTLGVDCRESVSVELGFIFRLLKCSRGYIERRKIDGEAWHPAYSRFTGSGRVFFIARIDLDQESEFSSYRRITPAQ